MVIPRMRRSPGVRTAPRNVRTASLIGVEMPNRFHVGDHVAWNSEVGQVSGTIIAVHTTDFDYKGHTRRATQADPQYEISSDTTDHVAAHKGSALRLADP
jgi:hypothetical protein